uniref:Uncharacterized protein n=1 Tax=Rhizophora mucronata TaxID=61149 RepID=A0A2P2Q5Z7_RHIMU
MMFATLHKITVKDGECDLGGYSNIDSANRMLVGKNIKLQSQQLQAFL